MKTLINFDLDGVLAKFTRGVCLAHGREDETHRWATWAHQQSWGIPDSEFYAKCDRAFWAGLDVWPDGMALLANVVKEVGTKNIAFISSPTRTEGTHQGKREWFAKHVGPLGFDAWGDLFLGSNKEKFSLPGSVLVDDSDTNVQKFNEGLGHGWLVPRPWNTSLGVVDPSTGQFDVEYETKLLLNFIRGL